MKPKNYWTSLWLCAFIVIVFGLQQFPGFKDFFILDTRIVFTHLWTPLTAIFLHSGPVHLLYNLFALGLFGAILEYIVGTKKFLKLFFIAGLIASVASIPFYDRVLGASGAIFGIIGCLGILRPKMPVWVHSVPMPMWIALFVWTLGDVFGIFVPSNTANIAHLAGLAYGLIIGFTLRKEFKEPEKKKEQVDIDEEKVREWEKSF